MGLLGILVGRFDVAPQHTVMEDYEVGRDFPIIGRRSVLLNADPQ